MKFMSQREEYDRLALMLVSAGEGRLENLVKREIRVVLYIYCLEAIPGSRIALDPVWI